MTAEPLRTPPSPGRGGRRLALGALLSTAFVVFIGLGTWQVERRAWKLALIERVGQRVEAQAMPAPGPERWASVSRSTDEYRRVRISGRLIAGADTLVQAVTQRGAGYWLLAPLRTADGSVVLVNRGFVAAAPPRVGVPAVAGQPLTVTGLLRVTEPGGGFLRRNDPAADRWYSRDVAAIARARGLDRVAPYFIDADAAPESTGQRPEDPLGGLTVVQFSNNHLVYAITWYVLALLSVGAGWQLLREGRESPGRTDRATRSR